MKLFLKIWSCVLGAAAALISVASAGVYLVYAVTKWYGEPIAVAVLTLCAVTLVAGIVWFEMRS